MEALLKSDIFFFITSVSVIAVTALLIVVLIYVAEILRDIRHVSKNVKKESDHFHKTLHTIIEDVHKGGKKVVNAVVKIIPKGKGKRSGK
jgi:formate-dependent nitrite reductase membrane component NrfD